MAESSSSSSSSSSRHSSSLLFSSSSSSSNNNNESLLLSSSSSSSNNAKTIGTEYEGYRKWRGIVKGNNNCLYCIPFYATQILKIDPSTDQTTLVGQIYEGDFKWYNGFAHGDFIYGIPYNAQQFLKYNIITETSELVGGDIIDIGEEDEDDDFKWRSGAVADDGCFYCFPYEHNRILKFNPKDDTVVFVGEEIEGYYKFSGTVKAKNGCLYGIPFDANRVAKFNVALEEVTFIGDNYGGGDDEEDDASFDVSKGSGWMGGVEGTDDNIYGVPFNQNQWLKIDIVTDTTSLIGDDLSKYGNYKYDGGVVGEDRIVYAIPSDATIITKFNTTTEQMSEVRNRHEDNNYNADNGDDKWSGGVLHPNGHIYCAPYCHNNVLKIKTNHIRDEGNMLLQSNSSLTEFNEYINSNQFEYIYVTHKAFYDRLVSYRNSLIVMNAKLALE